MLGRITANSAAVASGNPQNVNTSVLRLETAYDTAGQAYLFTSYNAASSGSVVNQVQRTYNGLGQLITEYQAHGGSVNTSTSPKVQYAYSEMASSANHSRLKSMTYPNGRIVRYEYSSGLDTVISRLSFLADDSSGSIGTHLEEYSYLGASSVIKRAHPQPGVDLTYIMQSGESAADAGDQYTGLDRFGRVVDQRWIVTSGGTHTDRFQYGYDRDSNRLFKNNLVASAQSELYHANGTNGYDSLNRLTDFKRGTLSASGSVLDTVSTYSRTQSWTLDALGNMPSVSTNGTSESRTHNSQNQITAIASTSTSSDDNGSLTNDGTQSYLYDIHNRLIEVKNAAGTTSIVTYAYDALGRRITESPNGGTATDVYYSANWQALEDVQSGHAKSQYVWSPIYIDAMIERDRDADSDGSHTLEERLYAQHDANFNLTSVINTSGSVQERNLFDPYGSRTVTDSSFSPRSGNTSSFAWIYGHQGLKQDEIINSVSNRTRMLSATMLRFLTRDQWEHSNLLTLIERLNVYAYEANHPTVSLDSSGRGFTIIPDNSLGRPGFAVEFKTQDDCPCSGRVDIVQAIESGGLPEDQSNFDVHSVYGVVPRVPPAPGSDPLGYVLGGAAAWPNHVNGAYRDAPLSGLGNIDHFEVCAVCHGGGVSTILMCRAFSFNEANGKLDIKSPTPKPSTKIWNGAKKNWTDPVTTTSGMGGGYSFL